MTTTAAQMLRERGGEVRQARDRLRQRVQAEVLERVADAVGGVEEAEEGDAEDDQPHERVAEEAREAVELDALGGDDEAGDDDQRGA